MSAPPDATVSVPLASIVVAPLMGPASTMPPLLLSMPPEMEAPSANTVREEADVMVPDPVVSMAPGVEMEPEAETSVTPVTDPVFVMLPSLLLIPPEMEAPPEVTVSPLAEVMVPVPVVYMSAEV